MMYTLFNIRMIAAGAQPSEITYTAMLAMWGNSGSPRASEGIIEVFRHMQSAGRQLDTVGYRYVFILSG
jgi:hypothetical protein